MGGVQSIDAVLIWIVECEQIFLGLRMLKIWRIVPGCDGEAEGRSVSQKVKCRSRSQGSANMEGVSQPGIKAEHD